MACGIETGQGTGQCPTHFSQATSETRLFRRTLTCPLYRISILLIVGGFICPPIGVIDSSVLTAVGMLLAFAILAQIPTLIEAAKGGKTIRLQKGDFSAEVSSEND